MADCRKRDGEDPGGPVLYEKMRKESRNKRTKTYKEPIQGADMNLRARGEEKST
jgi:hypothetical protein